jgi:hypothetical protein
MARKSLFTVVTNQNDPTFVKMFNSKDEALAFVGPEYDKKGFIVTTFEKKTETFFEVVTEEEEDEREESE